METSYSYSGETPCLWLKMLMDSVEQVMERRPGSCNNSCSPVLKLLLVPRLVLIPSRHLPPVLSALISPHLSL